jgi:hypothetical protein
MQKAFSQQGPMRCSGITGSTSSGWSAIRASSHLEEKPQRPGVRGRVVLGRMVRGGGDQRADPSRSKLLGAAGRGTAYPSGASASRWFRSISTRSTESGESGFDRSGACRRAENHQSLRGSPRCVGRCTAGRARNSVIRKWLRRGHVRDVCRFLRLRPSTWGWRVSIV